jgi:hypothetical protein
MAIYKVLEDQLSPLAETTFAKEAVKERDDLQRLLKNKIEIISRDTLVISEEFGDWQDSKRRIDLLGIEKDANIVVIELKRTEDGGHMDLQAIRYAAMVSSMSIDDLVPYYTAYKKKYDDEQLSELEAKEQIVEFVESDSFTELSTKPRIILCSEGFSQEITTTVLWLRDSDIDISCVSITPYKVDEKVIIVPKVVIPLEEARQYLIEIKRKEEKEQTARKSRPKTMKILLENKLVTEGEQLLLSNDLPSWVKDEFDSNNPVFRAKITGKQGQSNAVIWEKDEQEYSVSALAWKIFKELHPDSKDPGGVNGNWHWVNSEEKPLWNVAEDFLSENA